MDILKWLGLGPKGEKPTFESVFTDKQKALFKSLALPAIRLEHGGNGFSRLGGLPDMPDSVPWPHDESGAPLAFLVQLDLAALPLVARKIGLPEVGCLWFFYDQRQRAGGFDPKDGSKWRAVYANSAAETCNHSPAPSGLKRVYPIAPVVFTAIETYPDSDVPAIAELGMSDLQRDLYIDHVSAASGMTHMLGGYSDIIQGPDMALQCQLASNGISCSDPRAFETAEARALSAGASAWRPLMQVASDDKARMNWGDGGMLYFWIRDSDLKAARFDKVWMVVQCY